MNASRVRAIFPESRRGRAPPPVWVSIRSVLSSQKQMSRQWKARIRRSKSGGCQPNHATYTGAGCFDLASARATTFWRLLLTSDQISTGMRSGKAFAYAATTSFAFSPKPGPNPARTFTFSATSSSVIASSFASFQLGDCSLSVEQIIIGTDAAVGAGPGT
jgi:hypothetical protein